MALSRESSFDTWPSDSSKDDVQSVNSGVESESISPRSEAANGAMTSTHQAATPATNEVHIDKVSANLINEDKIHPDDTVLTAEHHLQTLAPNITNGPTQHLTPTLSQQENEDLKEKQLKGIATLSTVVPVQATEQKLTNVLVYDIATLLELSKGPVVTPAEIELCDDDIKENVFKDSLKEDHTRLRGLSNTSTAASEPMETEEQIVFLSQAQRSQRKPIRQPYGPPQSSLAQQHAGFARFLREHASPPHHRVTAGGRIVPNSPLSPPPVFRLDTIDSVFQQSQNLDSAAQPQHASKPEMTSSMSATPIEQPSSVSAGLTDSTLGPTNASSKQPGYAAPLGSATNTSEGPAAGSKVQHQASVGRPMPNNVSRVLQLPPGAVPTMALPEGGLIVNFQGTMFRATLSQANTTLLEPLQVICHAPQVQQPIPSYPPVNTYFNGSMGFQPVTMHPTSMPLANLTNGAHLFQHHQMQIQAQIQALQNQHDSLNSQLEGLDRHVALYRPMLSPMVNASMVAQRMQLVQQLDNIRVNKDRLERSKSMAPQTPGFMQQLQLPQGSQAAFEQYGSQNFQTAAGVQSYPRMLNVGNHRTGVAASTTAQVPHGVQGQEVYSSSKISKKTPKPQTEPKNSRYLSPDAPAFIPNNTSASGFYSGGKTQGQCHEQNHKNATHQFAHTATPKLTCPAHVQLPKVTQDDVEYADRFGFNDEPGPKRYCSTIEEYQEVIRRVREQARMYGCAGGQSKDPEHDAEEDIRWAMSDKDAIPLPTTVPDHVANPRPWKWADSPFNIRADEEAYFANPVRFKDGGNGPSNLSCITGPWGPVDDDYDSAVAWLKRKDSWNSLPDNAADLAPIDLSNWGNLPSDIKARSALGPTLAWGEIAPPQAEYNGGAPPPVSNVDGATLALSTTLNKNTHGEVYTDGWYSPGKSSSWPKPDNRQDGFVYDGWNTPPPSKITASTTDVPWGYDPNDPNDPYFNQREISHTATKNNQQDSEVSGKAKARLGEPTGSHVYAEKPSNDVNKLQTGQHLYPAKAHADTDGWNSPGKSSSWPKPDNRQDGFVYDGWNSPPSKITASTTDVPWGYDPNDPNDPYFNQREISHTATKNNQQDSEVSGKAKARLGEPTGSHVYAEKPSNDMSKLQTGQHLYPAKAHADTDGWNSPGKSSSWPKPDNRQDGFVYDGWNSPPSKITASTTDVPWGYDPNDPNDPYFNQREISHTATKNNQQDSEVSGKAKARLGEPTGSHVYAEKPSNDMSKLQTGQHLYPAKAHAESNHKPRQAYVEDVVDSPTWQASYCDTVAKGTSPRAEEENPCEGIYNKDDDDCSSLDSWVARSDVGCNASEPIPECVLRVLRRPGFMDIPLPTNMPSNQTGGLNKGKVFDPSEVKAVRVPSPARNAEVNPFYLDMMKDPRYSVITGDHAPPSDLVDRRDYGSGKTTKKENQNVQAQANAAVRGEDNTKLGRPQNHQGHKAPSSIAAPVYQAHGYLPQYDGAASSLDWGDSTVGPHRLPPSRALVGGGVSIAGPPPGRMDRFSTGHYGAGPHFLRNLREQEREDMARHKPFNPANW